MQQYLLGIDVGTTGTKTLLISEKGEVAAHAYRPYRIITPAVGWSEQRAEDWWQAVVETVRETVQTLDNPSAVRAISLSLQGGTVVPVDENGNPLRNAIVWTDGRCAGQFREFVEEGGSDEYTYQTCGWHMSTGLPALDVRWIRDNEPDIFRKTAKFLTVPDYISMKMTGIAAADFADAGINEFCNIREERYDEKLMSFAGITEKQLPILVHTGDVIGTLTKEAAAELGLSEKTILVTGAHDQYAVAVGAGANRAGDVVIGSGTAWVVTGIFDEPSFHTGLAQSVAAVPGKWGSIFSLSTGGICLEWLRNQIAQNLSYEEINGLSPQKTAAAEGMFFYPFQGIAGGRKRFARASFTGLDLAHDRFSLARAVMEGVVFQTKWMLESFRSDTGSGIRLAGGASKSPVWTQIIADILDKEVLIPEVADLSCVGAAVIAGWGSGLYGSIEEGCEHLHIPFREAHPDPDEVRIYRECYPEYRKNAEILWQLYQKGGNEDAAV